MLLVHTATNHSCSDAQRRRLLLYAIQTTSGSASTVICEGSKLVLVYTTAPGVEQVVIVQDALLGITVRYASEPHVHNSAADARLYASAVNDI